MKKAKRFTALLLAVLTALTLTACGGGKSKDISVDVQKLADELNQATITSDTLTAGPKEMIAKNHSISEDLFADGAAYVNAAATACEVVVFACKEEAQTKDVVQAFKDYTAHQSELYASYNAGEVDKLKDAVIKSAGKYVVLCVCDDTKKAEEILKNYGF